MKKILSLILAALMCLPVLTPALADDGDTVARLILDMKEKFDISDDEFVFENYNKDDYNETVTYYLSWKSKASDEYSYQPYISVRVDEDGNVEYYRKSTNSSGDIVLAKFTEAEALAEAKELIGVVAPDRAASLDEGTLEEGSQYSVRFERIENATPVAGDYISVTLHPDDLSLTGYNASWTDAEFPSLEGVIGLEKAEEAYKSNIGYELIYNIKTENREITDIYLSYESKDSSAYIDAFSGDAVKHTGVVFKTSGGGAMNESADAFAEERSLSPEEQKMVDDINNMITKEEAESIARSVPEFDIRADAEVSGYSVSANSYGEYVARINFSVSARDDYYNAGVSVNAQTKEIMSFSKYEDIKDTQKIADPEKAKETAEAFLNRYYPHMMAEVKPDFVIGEQDEYRFNYDRYANDIRVKNNGIRVYINEYTGDIDNFSYTWAETEFPSKDGAVAPNMIYKSVLTDDNFRLQYMTTTEYVYNEKTGKETSSVTVQPVYAVLSSPIYHGLTGDEIDYRGMKVTAKFSGYTDISGHWCETAANELAKIGIYFEGGSLEPDKAVTQAEYLKLMYRIMYGYYYSDDSDIYRQLIAEGVLTEDEIAVDMTRIDGIRYFINALGYKEVAGLSGIYNCPFADVADNMQGYAAIAGGLGIINNTADTLRADALMTRGECLTIIYNYLKK